MFLSNLIPFQRLSQVITIRLAHSCYTQCPVRVSATEQDAYPFINPHMSHFQLVFVEHSTFLVRCRPCCLIKVELWEVYLIFVIRREKYSFLNSETYLSTSKLFIRGRQKLLELLNIEEAGCFQRFSMLCLVGKLPRSPYWNYQNSVDALTSLPKQLVIITSVTSSWSDLPRSG